MTLTMDVNKVLCLQLGLVGGDEFCNQRVSKKFWRILSRQAHSAVGGLRQELLPEIAKKIDEPKVEEEFTQAIS